MTCRMKPRCDDSSMLLSTVVGSPHDRLYGTDASLMFGWVTMTFLAPLLTAVVLTACTAPSATATATEIHSVQSSSTALRRLTSAEISNAVGGKFVTLADIVGGGAEQFFEDGRYEIRTRTLIGGRYEIENDALCVTVASSPRAPRCYALLISSSGDIYRSMLDAQMNEQPGTIAKLTISERR